MTITAEVLAQVIAELQPLLGAKIQRADLVAPRELVIELRIPKQTVRLLFSAQPGAARCHWVPERPPRLAPAGPLQAVLRRKLVGQPLVQLTSTGRTITLDARAAVLTIRLDGKPNFQLGPPSGVEPPVWTPAELLFSKSTELHQHYGVQAPQAARASLMQALLSGLRVRQKKLQKLVVALRGDLEQLRKMERLGRQGELLKSQLHLVQRGNTSVSVTNWETGEPELLGLDPALGPKENLARFFAKSKKAQRGLPVVQGRLAQAEAELKHLTEQQALIETSDLEALQRLAEDAPGPTAQQIAKLDPSARPATKNEAHPLDKFSRRFVAADGTEIRVGKGAEANDRLTLSGAKGDDIWLHARGTAGAHVVLRNSKGASPSSEALLDAAHLAAFYSSAKNDSKVEITYTEARYVKKSKGDPPGRVSVARGKTIMVTMEAGRLDRLLGKR